MRQFGRLEYDSAIEMLNVLWVASTHLGELVAPFCFETFDFMFTLDPETAQICSLHPPSLNLIFETNPTSVQRWADGYFTLLHPSSPEVQPFRKFPSSVDPINILDVSTSEKPAKNTSESAEYLPEEVPTASTKVTFAEPISSDKKTAKRKATSELNGAMWSVKSARRTGQTGPFICNVESAIPCKNKPEWCRLGRLDKPVRCSQHKEPQMLKHVGEDDKPTSAAKLSMKEVHDSCPDDYFAVAKAPTSFSQPKSIGDSLGIRKEVSPTKKVSRKCKVDKCKSKAVLAHKDEDGDHAVLCEEHGKAIEGTYPAAGIF